jgi:RNA polymerase sigma-70 factor (ECF subfamily)
VKSDRDLGSALEQLAQSRNNEDAWRELYLSIWPFVMAVNYRILGGSRTLAEDASQEVLKRIVAYCPFKEIRDPDAFRSYARAICRNVSRDYLQFAQRMPEVGLYEVHEKYLREWTTRETHSEEVVEANELIDRIFGTLDESDRQLLQLIIAGYSNADVAKVIGLTPEAARVRLFRIRGRLRNLLGKK